MRTLSKKEIANIISRNLKKIREQKNISQKDIEELTGIKQPQYYRYESGERLIPLTHLIKIAVALEVELKDLLNGIDEAMIN